MKKNELAISTQSAPLELVFSRQYREQRIKHLDSPDKIIELLNYLYVLLNVKKDNQLNEIEESVLNGVILNNFGNFSTNEIKHAFRLAVSGELELELYNKLDSITFGKVIQAYKKHKANKIKQFKSSKLNTKQPEITLEEKNKIEEDFINNCINPYVQEHKKMLKPKIDWATYAIFNHFWNLKYINLTEEEISKYKKEAQTYWQEHLQKERLTGIRVSLDTVMNKQTAKMYASCVALYHKMDDILKHIEIDFKGWQNKL